MLYRALFLACFLTSTPPATAQDAIVAKLVPGLSKLDRSKTLRGIRFAEHEVTNDLEITTEVTKPLTFSQKQREEYVAAYVKRARYCYRGLTLLFENTNFPNIAAIYRKRVDLYNDFLEKKLDETELKRRERDNEFAAQRALNSELAALEKNGPPNEGTIKSLERMGKVVGEIILTAAGNELGGVPEIETFNQGMMALQRDDHANAAKHLRPLAERGDPRAQFWIGHFYSEGKGGLPQSFPRHSSGTSARQIKMSCMRNIILLGCISRAKSSSETLSRPICGSACRLRRSQKQGSARPRGNLERASAVGAHPRLSSLKKSLPWWSITMKAGKFSTSIRQIASMPSSGYSWTSTFLMQCSARFAATPPIEPR
jgi:hypothetical protein